MKGKASKARTRIQMPVHPESSSVRARNRSGCVSVASALNVVQPRPVVEWAPQRSQEPLQTPRPKTLPKCLLAVTNRPSQRSNNVRFDPSTGIPVATTATTGVLAIPAIPAEAATVDSAEEAGTANRSAGAAREGATTTGASRQVIRKGLGIRSVTVRRRRR